MGSASYMLLFGVVVFSSASGALFVTVLDRLRRNRTRETSLPPLIHDRTHDRTEEMPQRSFAHQGGRPDAA
jgi:hypothetical protein